MAPRLPAPRDRRGRPWPVSSLGVPGSDTISFARGAPSLDIVAVDDLRAAAARALERDPAGAFAYGTAAGYPALVEWIAERHALAPENVIATNGSLQADAFLFRLLLEPGDQVVVEAPTYDRTLLGLREMGAEILAIELEEDGLDVDALERALCDGARPKLAHVIPNFHNPAGCTLSLEKRRRLLELAGEHGVTVFEDDPYVELRFEGDDLPTLLSLDDDERVVYASSFSKTICPGVRVGYLAGPESTIAAIRRMATNTYISPSMVSQATVAEFCRSGAIERSIESVKEALRARRDALARAASARDVAIVKGTDFLLEGGENSLRISYSGVTVEQIEEGVGRLAEAYAEAGQGSAAGSLAS